MRGSRAGGYAARVTTPAATAAVSWGIDRIDLFTVGVTRELMHVSFDGDRWSEPTSLGGRLASAPAATAWGVDELQVFAIFDDGQLWNRYWDGTSWHDWESTRRRADREAGRILVERRPDRCLRARPRRPRLAPLVGRHPVGRLGTTAA